MISYESAVTRTCWLIAKGPDGLQLRYHLLSAIVTESSYNGFTGFMALFDAEGVAGAYSARILLTYAELCR